MSFHTPFLSGATRSTLLDCEGGGLMPWEVCPLAKPSVYNLLMPTKGPVFFREFKWWRKGIRPPG